MTEIEKSLKEIFESPLKDEEVRKIVFWTDYDGVFENDFDHLELDHVKTLHLTKDNQFQTKYVIEEEDIESSYLIYTQLDLTSDENWLYDTYMYSEEFYADRLSLVMNELGVDSGLRQTVEKYHRFFNSKERRSRLQALNIHPYTVESLELGMMNVLCKTTAIDFEPVLRTVLMDTLDNETNHYLSEMNKYFKLETFWGYVKHYYDYYRETPSLKTLFMHLVMTAAIQSIDEKHLSNFNAFIADQNQTNAYVFIDHWMNHKVDFQSYNDYVRAIEKELKIHEVMNEIPIEEFQDADVFPYIDRAIIKYIANSLINHQEHFEEYLELISLRRTKHFYSTYQSIYEALHYTVKMHQFKNNYVHGLPTGNAASMYEAYTTDYYVMDSYYRKFYVAFDEDSQQEIMHKLKDLVEYLYTDWFMGELNTHWSRAVRTDLIDDWRLPEVDRQQRFYSSQVSPHLRRDERVFVIISDAFRYEAGKELQEKLQTTIRGDCELTSMLGVVPSVTKLGMASLLPHRELTIDNKSQVLVNGESTSGIESRREILQSVNKDSLALPYEELASMNITKQREIFKGKKMIYIYHDTIDAIGDQARTEVETFQAVEQAIDQLTDFVRSLTNNISATNVIITADHGFLYERDKLQVSDLMTRETIDALEMKRRYILSHDNQELTGQLCINLSSVIDNEPPLYAHVPNATIRYRVQGSGANFVHGGASLQEVAIPLLKIRNKRKGQQGAREIEKVDVVLTSTMRNITNSIFSLEFFQNERITDFRISRSVRVCMEDEAGNKLSNEEEIIADITSDNPKERMFKIQFVLKNQAYDRNKTYYLVVKDTETGVIVDRISFKINLGIVSDFDF